MRDPRRFKGLERTAAGAGRVPVASTLVSRTLGLALLARERAGAGLLIPRCRSIHTVGMRFPIDVFFLDAEGRVIELRRSVPPRRVIRSPGAIAVLEVSSP